MIMLDETTLQLWVALALLALLLVLVGVLLWKTLRRKDDTTHWLHQIVDAVEAGMHGLEGELEQQSLKNRADLLHTLQAVNDSLQATLGQAMQQQNSQLGSVQKQTFESNQAQEMRQHRMHHMTEENLQRFEQRMQSVEALLDQKLQQNEGRIEKLRETLEGSMVRLQADNSQRLEEMRKTVDEKLHTQLDQRLNESFSQVSTRLEQVYKSLGEMHTLSAGVGDLKKMLGNVKTRGIWGEMQLGSLLAQALTEAQYRKNVCVKPGSTERVEFAICLPGREGGDEDMVYLPVDSKFPQEDYTRLVEASQQGDTRGTEVAGKALENAVRTEARRICDKYIDPPHTTDFAVMFLPLESLYAEVMRRGALVEQIQREQRVVMAGPSTLLALVNSLQMGFRTLAIERRSEEVWKLLGAVKTDFGNFAKVLQRTQEKLQQASDSIDTAFVRTRSIERKLRRVEALDGEAAERVLLGEGSTADGFPPGAE